MESWYSYVVSCNNLHVQSVLGMKVHVIVKFWIGPHMLPWMLNWTDSYMYHLLMSHMGTYRLYLHLMQLIHWIWYPEHVQRMKQSKSYNVWLCSRTRSIRAAVFSADTLLDAAKQSLWGLFWYWKYPHLVVQFVDIFQWEALHFFDVMLVKFLTGIVIPCIALALATTNTLDITLLLTYTTRKLGFLCRWHTEKYVHCMNYKVTIYIHKLYKMKSTQECWLKFLLKHIFTTTKTKIFIYIHKSKWVMLYGWLFNEF